MKIVLLGYMGCGKSTIGKQLAIETSLPFIDLDTYIETKEGCSISQLFASKGEIYFRIQEHKYLRELLAKKSSFVLSLGGGTPCYSGNNALLLAAGVATVYLKATVATLSQRVQHSNESRPLLKDVASTAYPEFIAKHLFERAPYYLEAKHRVAVDEGTVPVLVQEILEKLH